MKKFLKLTTLAIVLITLFISCKKDTPFDAAKQAIIDDGLIQTYIKANNITAIKDPSGLYYQVITPGTGSYPTVLSTVNVNYSGKLLDGTVFDSGNITSALQSLIQGWQIGIPHINKGGRILLIIPSSLGYGNSSPGGGIPANAVLVFTVDLINF